MIWETVEAQKSTFFILISSLSFPAAKKGQADAYPFVKAIYLTDSRTSGWQRCKRSCRRTGKRSGTRRSRRGLRCSSKWLRSESGCASSESSSLICCHRAEHGPANMYGRIIPYTGRDFNHLLRFFFRGRASTPARPPPHRQAHRVPAPSRSSPAAS